MLVLPSQAGSTMHRLLNGRQARLVFSAYTPVVILLGVGMSGGSVRVVAGRERNEGEMVVEGGSRRQ